MYVYHYTEARSRNHCCRGKAIRITYFCACVLARARVCVWFWVHRRGRAYVRVALLIQHATRHHIVIYGLLSSSYFSTLSHTRQDFRKKKKL